MIGYEKLVVYQKSLVCLADTFQIVKALPKGNSDLTSQLRRAGISIVPNIAEGAGKTKEQDKKRFYSIARGSAMECAAIYDILFKANLIEKEEFQRCKGSLMKIIKMLSSLCLNK